MIKVYKDVKGCWLRVTLGYLIKIEEDGVIEESLSF